LSRLHRNAQRFITTRRYPIYYMSITKCGCTYLKNLMYYLDHDEMHPAGNYIHEHGHELQRADHRDPKTIVDARHVFTVLRDPVDRFFSLYFDKIYGRGPQNFGVLRKILKHDIGLDLAPDLPAADHTRNAHALIDWIDANLREETPEPVNPHWKPQHERLSKVAEFGTWRLTLDGLDWQLPWFLANVVPDIKSVMTAVKTRNTSSRGTLQSDVETPALIARIREIYSEDAENHAHSSTRWSNRQAKLAVPPKPPKPPMLRVLSTHRYRINAAITPKCGSTFLRNLFYRLDHGVNHPDPLHIDADKACVNATKEAARLIKELNIVVLRDPVERLLSFYFDKVWGEGTTAFPWLARTLATNRRFNKKRDIDAAAHHDNIMRFLGLLETRFAKQEPGDLNPHWRPQTHRLAKLRASGFKPLLLEDLNRQLPLVLGHLIPNIAEEMAAVPTTNQTKPPFPYGEFRTPYILERLNPLYCEDMALHTRLAREWAGSDTPPKL